MSTKPRKAKLKTPPEPGYSVLDLKGTVLFKSLDLLECMDVLREHEKGRVCRNHDDVMLAFMTGPR